MEEPETADRVSGNLNALLKPLTDTVADLELQRSALALQLTEIDRQIRRARKVLTAAEAGLGRETTRPVTPRPNRPRVGQEIIEQAARYMKKHPERAFTAIDLSNEMGIKKTDAHSAIHALRDEGRIRLTGKPPRKPGQKGVVPNQYKLMPEELNGDQP
jgi:hypothetical protein